MRATSYVDLKTNIGWYQVRCACGTRAEPAQQAQKARQNAVKAGFVDNRCGDCLEKFRRRWVYS